MTQRPIEVATQWSQYEGHLYPFKLHEARARTRRGSVWRKIVAYSSELGRWVQQDPAGYVDGVSLYEALISSPTTKLDPDGLHVSGTGGGGSQEVVPDRPTGGGPTTQPSGPTTTTCPTTGPTTRPRPSDAIARIVDRLNSNERIERERASRDLKPWSTVVIKDALDRPDWELSPEQRNRLNRECLDRELARDAAKLIEENSKKPFGPSGPSGPMRR
jgi:RHS repeat-associated protein